MIQIILKIEIRGANRKFKISSEETKEDFYSELRNVTYI